MTTLRLDDHVLRGELDCTGYYAVSGWLQLRDDERAIHLQLTGTAGAGLHGWKVRFEAPPGPDVAPPPLVLEAFHWQQIGPTGAMTCRADRGHLELEWFGQDGRLTLEWHGAEIEFVDNTAEEPVAVAEPLRLPEEGDGPPADFDDDPPADEAEEATAAVEEVDDPYGLFPADLDRQLARGSDDDGPPPFDDTPPLVREMELMDELIDRGPGEIIGTLFDGPLRLPRPDALADADIEPALKAVLAQMALWGISLHVCVHFSLRDVYRLVVEHICKEGRSYPELRQTQWVQGYTTSEFCRACEEEMEREMDEWDRKQAERGDEPPAEGGEDIPF